MNTTREEAKLFRIKLNAALAPVAKEMGMALEIGSVTFGADLHTKVTFTKVGEGVDPTDETAKYKANVKTHGFMFGATENLIGLKNRNGEEFVGIAPNRPTYPIVIRKPNGKILLTTRAFIDGLKLFNKITALPSQD